MSCDYVKALAKYSEGISLATSEKQLSLQISAQLFTNRSLCHIKLGNPKQALADANFVLEIIDPTNQRALERKAAAEAALS